MNLLKNPGFNEGHHRQDNVPELVVPDGWRLYFLDNETFPGGSAQPAFRPESVVWNIKDAPEHERDIFFLDGDYCLKVFKAHAPVYFALSQMVAGLTPGRRYRFTAQVHPDIVRKYEHGKKVYPGDIWHAESRAGWSEPGTPWSAGRDGRIAWGGWFNVNNGNFTFGEYGDVWVEFDAPADGRARVWLECKAKWGNAENNWFMDAFSLEDVGLAEEPLGGDTGPGSGTESGSGTEPGPGTEPGTGTEPGSGAEPEPGRGAPRIQYARTYILLPADVAPAMAQAAMRAALAHKLTVGFVPDDAGIGDLDQRRVICVNPDEIGTGIASWFDTFYHGVVFVPVEAHDAVELEVKLEQVL